MFFLVICAPKVSPRSFSLRGWFCFFLLFFKGFFSQERGGGGNAATVDQNIIKIKGGLKFCSFSLGFLVFILMSPQHGLFCF